MCTKMTRNLKATKVNLKYYFAGKSPGSFSLFSKESLYRGGFK